jgi:hypothetical protein
MPETWNESAKSAITAVYSVVIPRNDPSPKLLREYLDKFINSLYDRPAGSEKACALFSEIGAEAIEIARLRMIPLSKEHCLNVLVKKQKDYGPENIRRFGRQGLLVRLHDKVARLENLEATGRSSTSRTTARLGSCGNATSSSYRLSSGSQRSSYCAPADETPLAQPHRAV